MKLSHGITIPVVPERYFHVFQLFSILAEQRDGLMAFLENRGIMTKIYFPPAHKTHFYNGILGYQCKLPVTEKVAEQIVSVPFYPGILQNEMDYVVQSIQEFYNGEVQ